ncbi:MAG TPA: hypothetical protein VG963_25560 [Polyangiaceae bacterium]|nr:hypothetical protein [Polyangiaceae bacterium]
MDKGSLFEHDFTIMPGHDDTFIVQPQARGYLPTGEKLIGFSTIDHLIRWLSEHARAWECRHGTTGGRSLLERAGSATGEPIRMVPRTPGPCDGINGPGQT